MGLSGLLLWYGAPFQGATSSVARASVNGGQRLGRKRVDLLL
jgi:hypothetical protein